MNVAISPGQITTRDHIPIIIQLATSPIMLPSIPRFSFNKEEWESFREELSQTDEINLDHFTIDKIDNETNKWFDQVTKAMDKHVPKTIHRTIPYPQITPAIKATQQEFKNIVTEITFQGHTVERRRKMGRLKEQLKDE